MKFAINERFTEARMWLSEFIKPTPKQAPVKAVTPASPTGSNTITKQDVTSLMKLIKIGNNLSSIVRDKQIDRMDNWGVLSARNDVRQLNGVFKTIEALHTDSTLRSVNSSLTKDGIKKGFKFEFSATTNNEDQKVRARIINEICRQVAALINGDQWSHSDNFLYQQDMPITLADASYNLGMFANIPIHIKYDDKNIMSAFRPLTPFMWQINSDSSFRYIDPEKAFTKFGSETQELDKSYPATNIVWGCAGSSLDYRYAMPASYNLAVEVSTLQHIVNSLKESRTQGSPKTFLFSEGQAGQGLTLQELQRLLDDRPEEALMRGDYLGPLANLWNQVIPGKGDVKTVNAGTGLFNEFGDANLVREIITASYNQHFGLFFDTHKANRSTLDFIIRMRSEARRAWKMNLVLSIIFPTFRRQIVAAGIDSTGLICEVTFDEEKTFEELEAETNLAITLRKEKLLSWDSAHSVGCKAISIDPKVDKEKMDQEKVNPNDLESQLANSSQLTAEQLIKNSLPNITKNDFEKLNQTLLDGLEKIQDIVQSNHLN